jgi:hypothetical protein
VKRAGPEAIAKLETLPEGVRKHGTLVERKPGIFYRGTKAFLHFHEDAEGLFADLKVGDSFERLRVSLRAEQGELLKRVAMLLKR